MTTAIVAVVFLGLMLAGLLFSAWLLQLGARWVKAPALSYRRAVGTLLLGNAIALLVGVPLELGLSQAAAHPIVVFLMGLIVQFGLTFAIVSWSLRTTYPRAFLAWLPTLLSFAVSLGIAVAVVRPYLFEAYKIPTNSMAPTILGDHRRRDCPKCGGVLITSAFDFKEFAPQQQMGICVACQRTSLVDAADESIQDEKFGGDRILVTKFLKPRRWDLIVFRNPEDPSVPYVKRLVGLPGEEIALRDDAIWIDGVRAEQPPEIAAIVYSAGARFMERDEWGPARLGPDEYFVLGDFSLQAKDSRFWSRSAPGHASYAVPASYIIGVVTHLYWPPIRWRIFR